MTKLAQTLGLTEFQTEIVATVRQFVDKEVIPNAPELERSDTYPQEIVDQMREMGLFGLMIPEEYGGLGESLLTYALCVEELARGWMSVSGRHQHAFHRCLHAAPARHRRAEAALPAADGDGRDPRRVLDVRAGARVRRRRDPHPGTRNPRRRLHHQRPEDVADQWRQLDPGCRAGAHRRRRGEAAPQPDGVPHREANRFRRSRARADDPRQDRQARLQGHRHHGADLRRIRAPAPTTSSAARPARASSR